MVGEGGKGEGRVDGSEVGRMERRWEGGKDGEMMGGREGWRDDGREKFSRKKLRLNRIMQSRIVSSHN